MLDIHREIQLALLAGLRMIVKCGLDLVGFIRNVDLAFETV